MEKIRLGRTKMMVSKLGLGGGALPKLSEGDAVAVVRKCLDLGITFIDTAAEYENSEKYIGKAISGRREELVISTKIDCEISKDIESDLKRSLKYLGNYIDLYLFHGVNNIDSYTKFIDPDGPMGIFQEAKRAGLIKHIGISAHSMDVAKVAVKSGLFETIMFPFNVVACAAADELLPLAREHDVGFIAMKPLFAGRLKNITAAFKYLFQFPDVVSIPGIERVQEVEEIIQIYQGPWQMTEAEQSEIQRLREEQGTSFNFPPSP